MKVIVYTKQWTNGPTLCLIVWLPFAPKYVVVERHVALLCIQMPNH